VLLLILVLQSLTIFLLFFSFEDTQALSPLNISKEKTLTHARKLHTTTSSPELQTT